MGFDTNGNGPDALDDIAVVGMACRLPGAPDLEAFEALLWRGGTGRRVLAEDELAASGVPPDLFRRRNYVPVCYPIDGYDHFDAQFFGYTDRAATTLDPQQRLFLECAYHAIEDAGLRTWDQHANIGVFAGGNLSTYLLFNLLQTFDPGRPSRSLEVLLANDKDYLASRLAYKLDLRGPSITVQTACSSSLVAICQASASLLNYECDAAVAGGVAVRTPHMAGYVHEAGGVMAPDGFCRSFDAQAQGTVFGNGVGTVVLKRLADALADRDRIHAVIKGFAVNNDGASKAGFSAPNVDGQARVMATALRASGVSAEEIGYVEAHGTGTAMGDPIEVAALARVFAKVDRSATRLIGSVKSNIGHCDSAAGIAGFIKAVIAVREGAVPPSLHFTRPNPKLDLERAGLKVATETSAWPLPGQRFAGVSSFGMGGVNAHVVLAQPPIRVMEPMGEMLHSTIALSAACPEALEALGAATADRLSGLEADEFKAFAKASLARRSVMSQRLAIVADSSEAAVERMRVARRRTARTGSAKVCLVFSGQGLFVPGNGRDLYASQPDFRRGVEAVIDATRDPEARTLLQEVFTRPTAASADAWWSPLAAFALQQGLLAFWGPRGLEPAGVIGHSAGEFAAAVSVGVLDLETAVEGLTLRSRQMSGLCPPGGMTAVQASMEIVLDRIATSAASVEIAAVNGARAVTVSGEVKGLEALERLLKTSGERFERLPIMRGCHSALVDPMVAPFLSWFERQRLGKPLTTMYRTGGGPIDDVSTPAYWAQQLRRPVLFDAAVERAESDGHNIFLEIGPGAALTVLGKMRRRESSSLWVSSLSPRLSEVRGLDEAAAELWTVGAISSLGGDEHAAHFPLPNYPFQRRRFWQEAVGATKTANAQSVESAALAAAAITDDLRLDRLAELQAQLSTFSLAVMQRALQELAGGGSGWDRDEDLIEAAGVAIEHRSLVRRWIERLRQEGRLAGKGEPRFTALLTEAEWLDVRERTLTLLGIDDGYAQYLADCADLLVPVVRGRTPALETLFPKGRFDIVDGLYRTSPIARYFNGVAQAAVRAISDLAGQTSLSILEIGAGTGGFTSALLPALEDRAMDYWFTDISDFFFRRARRELADHPVRFKVHDIDRSAADNGVIAGSFDIVAASNVLHATPDLERAVRNAVDLLAPGGWIIINELVRNEPWLEITVGLVEGWRLHADEWRTEGPLASADRWRDLLARCGLEEITFSPGLDVPAAMLGQHIILGRKPGVCGDRPMTTAVGMGDAPPEREITYGRLRALLEALPVDERRSRVEDELRDGLATRLGLERLPADLEAAGFFEMGIDSLKVVEFAASLSDELDLDVPSAAFFDFPTIGELAGEVLRLLPGTAAAPASEVLPGAITPLDDDELLRRLEARLAGHV